MKKERIAGIDIIKTLAVIFVLSIHQIGMTHVLKIDLIGIRPFFIMLYRYTVMSCVPLFIMTTGYLQCKKDVSVKFYKGIVPILLSYLVSSIGIAWINTKIIGDPYNLRKIIINIFNFTENNYAWYVEMFVGLYLLIPFINKLYHSIETRRKKQILLGILIFLTICPGFFYMFNDDFYNYNVFPDYWESMYPLTYYLLGAYFNEYKPKLNKLLSAVFVLAAMLMPTLTEVLIADGSSFNANVFNGFNSVSALLITVAIFVFFYDMDIKFAPCKWLVRDISVSTLEIYLWSNGVEKLLYPNMPEEFPLRLFKMIVFVFIGSYILAKIQRIIFWLVRKIIGAINTSGKHIKE